MNQDPNSTQTGGNTAFSSHTNATQTNPFTGDLKGEFTSDFGTNTNAVSQIFKNNGFGGQDRQKMILIGVAFLALVVGAFFFFTGGEDEEFNDFAETPAGEDPLKEGGDLPLGEDPLKDPAAKGKKGDEMAGDAATDPAAAADPMAADPMAADPAMQAGGQAAAGAGQMMGGSTGAITISAPYDGAQQAYDETQGPSTFSWSGPADRIVFSRFSSMQPVERTITLKGATSYRYHHPHTGTWYWRVENAEGASAVQSFTVLPPVRRNIQVTAPTAGGTLAGSGGVVSWQGDQKVARYQVQLVQSGQSWANPSFRFGTSGTSVSLQGVPAGSYDLRVGGFSEVAGRWEWQMVGAVTVQ